MPTSRSGRSSIQSCPPSLEVDVGHISRHEWVDHEDSVWLTPSERSGNRHAVLVDREQNLSEVREEIICSARYLFYQFVRPDMSKEGRSDGLVLVTSSVILNNSVLNSSNGSTNPNSETYFEVITNTHQLRQSDSAPESNTHHFREIPPFLQLFEARPYELWRRLQPTVAQRIRARSDRPTGVRVVQHRRIALGPERVGHVVDTRREPVFGRHDVLRAVGVDGEEVGCAYEEKEHVHHGDLKGAGCSLEERGQTNRGILSSPHP